MNELKPNRMLVILAHPDDESFALGGTLAKYAHYKIEKIHAIQSHVSQHPPLTRKAEDEVEKVPLVQMQFFRLRKANNWVGPVRLF